MLDWQDYGKDTFFNPKHFLRTERSKHMRLQCEKWCMGGPPLTLALAGRVLISWMRKVSGFTMITRGIPVVCCTQHTSPGWFITSDHWHRAGDTLLLPPLDLEEEEDQEESIVMVLVEINVLRRNKRIRIKYFKIRKRVISKKIPDR